MRHEWFEMFIDIWDAARNSRWTWLGIFRVAAIAGAGTGNETGCGSTGPAGICYCSFPSCIMARPSNMEGLCRMQQQS
jgi:hypothetical protein